ncbi:hypothetical protein [Frateuria soli]|uniref:hypothetical protein n=1 Tax=Frateuria soli TaxID=1542730 RepID=UPI001E381387|nr:hypothetical protein [Frateuria soli]UGB39116.1 hypothetical protein LQ771_04530 [Frateuria soli]
MTTSKKVGRKPGRPPKPKAEKPAQFSVRLRPDAKLALEILAADNNLSLSNAVELAVSQLLTSHPLSNGMTAREVVERIETQPIAARLLSLYELSPRFLEYQDRATMAVIFGALDYAELENEGADVRRRKKMEADKFVIDNWRALSSALQGSWAGAPRLTRTPYRLRDLIAPPASPDNKDALPLLKSA